MSDQQPGSNIIDVRAMIADAQPVAQVRRLIDPDLGMPRGEEKPGEWTPCPLGLPRECPVIPLGVMGNCGYYIDAIGQVQELAPPYGKGHILGLFQGRANYLAWAWPRWGKKGIDGFAAEDAAAALIQAAAAKGPWQSVEKIRGRGAWTDAAGGLIVHTGSHVLAGGQRQPPGEIEGFVYPTRPALPTPWPEAVADDKNPAKLLRQLLRSWQWARPDVDPVLLFGWIGAAFLGGALPWRPAVYLTGDKATGKSTLQSLIKSLLGDYLIQAVDTTGAGIYQHIGTDSLAISVDELEGETDVRKAKAVLKLARIAASGGLMLRGGDRHNPVQFRARSCFIFSSINTPPLEPQDLSRMAILRMAKLPKEAPPPTLDEQSLGVIGRCILRRLIEEWPRFQETWAAYKGELARAGMDGRGQDTFGTLLTCADMIEFEGWDEARLKTPSEGDMISWSKLMAVAGMYEFEDAAENWRLCLSHLLNVRVDVWRSGHRNAVGQVLDDLWHMTEEMNLTLAKSLLSQAGLGLIHRKSGPRDYWLAVPNQNPLTRALFDGSKWAGDIGAGVWAGALRQSPRDGDMPVHDVAKARVNGDVAPCTMISLKALYDVGGLMWEEEG